VKFLVDQQLPPALAGFLRSQGHDAQHVRELGLKEADDAVIWRHAAEYQMVVVSKDEDFYFLAVTDGGTGRLVWVKIGNCRKAVLMEKFRAQLAAIVAALEAGNRIVEIR
jgi:predicted nuclease of predicted toxin-antitoxin system